MFVITKFTFVISDLPVSTVETLIDGGSEVFTGSMSDDVIALADMDDDLDILLALGVIEDQFDPFDSVEILRQALGLFLRIGFHAVWDRSMSIRDRDLHADSRRSNSGKVGWLRGCLIIRFRLMHRIREDGIWGAGLGKLLR